jgi:hypothetical protein
MLTFQWDIYIAVNFKDRFVSEINEYRGQFGKYVYVL